MLYLRSLIFNIVGYSVLIMGCITNSIIGAFSQKATIKSWNYVFIPLLVYSMRYLAGIKIEIRGQQYIKQNGVIYAGKHESAMETYTLTNWLKRATFILKKELTYIPVFGWAQKFYGMIPVDRSAGSRAMKEMLRHAQDRVNQGRPIIIFPEGTRKQPGQPSDYKPGVALLYQHLNLPVVPIATNTGLFWRKSSFLRYPGTVIFEFMEPIPCGLSKQEFMTELEHRIETKCKELNEESIKKYPYTQKQMYKEK